MRVKRLKRVRRVRGGDALKYLRREGWRERGLWIEIGDRLRKKESK